ncbi:unnamed protein product [Plutella xylostella]|uniref:(diamondback moth) hypothetical protein n=1 Tax=Plutella xylostella TaxID=51655 RepID=A0A8S4G2E7_PLUXY|nr:unnamed protein product [Plutella xylostella]
MSRGVGGGAALDAPGWGGMDAPPEPLAPHSLALGIDEQRGTAVQNQSKQECNFSHLATSTDVNNAADLKRGIPMAQ